MKKLLIAICMALSMSAQAELVVVVPQDSPIQVLTQKEVKDIFTGRFREAQGVSISPVDLPSDAPARDQFYEEVFGKSESQMRSYWARMIFTGKGMPPREAQNVAVMTDILRSGPSHVGYMNVESVPDNLRVVYRP